jgi:hypothetical protein
MSLWRAEHRRGLGRRAHALPANHRLGCSAAMTPSPHGRLRRLPRHDFKRVASLSRPEISVNKLAAISSLTSFNAPAASSRRLGGKQEVALARRADNSCGGVGPDARYVSRSEDTERQDPIHAANEVPFLLTASELRDRKIKRRQKYNAQKAVTAKIGRRAGSPPRPGFGLRQGFTQPKGFYVSL